MELLEEHRCFEGWQQRWRHDSSVLNCAMTFSIFLPPQRSDARPPVLYWLSGLTCNDENFTTKAGAQRVASELGIVLVMPDTSPRGDEVADADSYDRSTIRYPNCHLHDICDNVLASSASRS